MLKLKNKNIKILPHSLFLEGQMHLNPFSCYRFVETIFKMKQNILVTTYTETFNFAYVTYRQRFIYVTFK